MIKKLKELHSIHVKDYINLLNNNNIDYSIIVKTNNIKFMSSSNINYNLLFEDYISITVDEKLRKNIDFLNKTINIKTDVINNVVINCNMLIAYHNIQTFSIDNKIIYVGNINRELEEKLRLFKYIEKTS